MEKNAFGIATCYNVDDISNNDNDDENDSGVTNLKRNKNLYIITLYPEFFHNCKINDNNDNDDTNSYEKCKNSSPSLPSYF